MFVIKAHNQTEAFHEFCTDSRRKGPQIYENQPPSQDPGSAVPMGRLPASYGVTRRQIESPFDYGDASPLPNRRQRRFKKSLVDISEETEYLKEIKDVMDELNSMARVVKQQLVVLEKFPSGHKIFEKVYFRSERIKQFHTDAMRVYDAVSITYRVANILMTNYIPPNIVTKNWVVKRPPRFEAKAG
jgi:hypothetical protein